LPPGIDRLVLLDERAEPVEQGVDGGQTRASIETPEQPAASDVDMETAPLEAQGVESAVADAQAEIETADETTGVETEPVCQTIGPLLNKDDAESISKLLSGQGYQTGIRTDKLRMPAGYWVYLPAMPAREARSIVADLDANGMKDYFIGKQNYISLGIFSDKGKARVRRDKVQKLGYEAILDQRYRNRTVHWLDIEERGQPLQGSQLWENIQSKHADIRIQEASCE
jgi:hypothetical protein